MVSGSKRALQHGLEEGASERRVAGGKRQVQKHGHRSDRVEVVAHDAESSRYGTLAIPQGLDELRHRGQPERRGRHAADRDRDEVAVGIAQ